METAKSQISQEQEKELDQIEMFGCTTAQIREEFNEASNSKMYLMGILSDVQEIGSFYMEYSKRESETQNQLLNKAKYVIDQLM